MLRVLNAAARVVTGTRSLTAWVKFTARRASLH